MQSSCLPLYMCTVYGLLNFVFLVALHHQKQLHVCVSHVQSAVLCTLTYVLFQLQLAS